MKRIYKIFMAVAAVAAVGCTTDATDDLGVNLNEGQTTLTLSLDDTRTQLGKAEKDANGKTTAYKLTWSAQDKISVNGNPSTELSSTEAGKSSATFTFNNGFGSAPYCVAYPAAPEGKVIFKAEQSYTRGLSGTDGTFSNGAAVMYGYAESIDNITLKHLTGVLKIGIVVPEEKSGNVQLNTVRISTVDRKPIAGVFDMDFATGKLTKTDYSKDVITWSAGEGVELYLSEQPTYVHIAVPAGVYDELYVTIEATDASGSDSVDGVMYATVKAPESKPLTAGVVREFSTPITYEPIDTNEVYVIKDKASLEAFAVYAKTGTKSSLVTKNAVLVADIDMTSVDWTPINCQYYVGTFKGNGFAINGLNNPLFHKTSASIDGVHLTNVNITSLYDNDSSTANNRIASLVQTYYGGSIKNCTVGGKIEYNGGDTAIAGVGGLVGHILPSKYNDTYNYTELNIVNCENKCQISITSTNNQPTWVAGIVGIIQKGTAGNININNCKNSASINIGGKKNSSKLGGIMGFLEGKTSFAMKNCHNAGTLSINGGAGFAYIGGLVGDMSTSTGTASFENCYNKGEVKFEDSETSLTSSLDYKQSAGGLVAYSAQSQLTLTDCYNDAAISVTGTIQIPRAGGILGAQNGGTLTLNNVYNSEKGSITFGTKEKTLTVSSLNVGGVLGSEAGTVTYEFTAPVVNKGDITVTNAIVSDASLAYIGGIASCLTTQIANAECYCTVKGYYWDGTTLTKYPSMGMVTGAAYSDTVKATNCKVGGKFCDGGVVDGDTFTEKVVELSDSNYYTYCYSNRDLTSIEGVGLLKSAPVVE